MTPILEPIDKIIDGVTYRLSKFPATNGRKIFSQYPLSALPKLGDYKVNEEIMLELMAHVFIEASPDQWVNLNSKRLVDQYVKSWETLLKLEKEMLEYNCVGLQNGQISKFLRDSAQKLPQSITKILTGSLESLLAKAKQP